MQTRNEAEDRTTTAAAAAELLPPMRQLIIHTGRPNNRKGKRKRRDPKEKEKETGKVGTNICMSMGAAENSEASRTHSAPTNAESTRWHPHFNLIYRQ